MPARRAVLLLSAVLPACAPAALLERVGLRTSGLRKRVAEASTLLPKGGPGLLGLDDALVSEQAPGTKPDAVLTPGQAIKGLYKAFNDRDADRVASFLTEDCVYEDLLLGPSTVCRGRDAFVNALRFHPAFVSDKLLSKLPFGSQLPDVVIEVDSIAEGVDTVGVEWHVQIKGDDGSDFPFPLGRGLSQAKVCVETGKIERVVDIAEAPWRVIGIALLPAIQAAQVLLSALAPKGGSPATTAAAAAAAAAAEKRTSAPSPSEVEEGSEPALTTGTITALFEALDADGSGYLDQPEIGRAAAKLGVPFESAADLDAFFGKLDTNGDGRISRAEFVTALTALVARD